MTVHRCPDCSHETSRHGREAGGCIECTCRRVLFRKRQDTRERLLGRLDRSGGPDACWEWQGYRNQWGYGMTFVHEDGKQKTVFAHRAIYRFEAGSIPEGLQLNHSCDNPPCCNPAHLQPGTHVENMVDRKVRGAGYPSGAQVYNAVQLDDETVAAIRADYRPGVVGHGTPALAAKYGLSRSTVQKIVTRSDRWKEPAA